MTPVNTPQVHPALAYAEQTLGVHKVHQEAVDLQEKLDATYSALDKAQDQRRSVTDRIADREAELLIEERGKHADSSATWLEQHMRSKKRKDPELTRLRNELNDVSSQIQGLEYDADMLKWRLKSSVARMEELGGYLHYLAVVKLAAIQAENPTKPTGDKQ